MSSITDFLLLTTMISLLILLVTFILYGFFLSIFARKNTYDTSILQTPFCPNVSIVVPTFNEGEFVKKKIENLFQTNYDLNKIEIIIADDSTDKTSIEIINELTNKSSRVRLCRANERRGYSRALIDASKLAKGEIIIITDCGSLYDNKTINELVQPLHDESIGGVTGAANILNLDEISGKSESFYRKIYNFMRKSESNADSTFHYHGEASAVKKELLSDIKLFPTNQDIAIAFHIRKKGYRVIFNSKARFYENSPGSLRDRYKQKSIRATGVIQVLLNNKSTFSPKYGLFGLVIYPAHLSMMLICPLFIALGSLSSVFLLLATIVDSWLIIVSFLLAFSFSLLIKKELTINLIQLELVLLYAIWRAFTDKSEVIYIEKIASTRR